MSDIFIIKKMAAKGLSQIYYKPTVKNIDIDIIQYIKNIEIRTISNLNKNIMNYTIMDTSRPVPKPVYTIKHQTAHAQPLVVPANTQKDNTADSPSADNSVAASLPRVKSSSAMDVKASLITSQTPITVTVTPAKHTNK